jgi:AcrR family transcriptional regulator
MTEDGLRERKKRATRIALSWAAVRLTVERGFDNVRVEDIAAEVGVSARTFNNYFASKGEAITARHLDRARLIAEELRARPDDEPLWTAITGAVLARFAMGQGDGGSGGGGDQRWLDGVRLMITEPALQADFLRANVLAEDELVAAVAERTGTSVDDLYPRLVATTVSAALSAAMAHWLRTDPPVPMGPLLTDALRQLAAGLPTP